ncbi:3-methyl-2-oxobutanoate hydroxymethyltransferase [Chryseobacterium polytrichastri]|uniref:3-methyl-2-oxobutanoate hydroxymethyltransferase n=1 Tax=Chryseobacterium polytrichastri TaxID=1302687 RepID=A0A1M6Q912_9FLAO|nr:3-methyl-2-oxobutanoate hydroxymethyltransferase [Chryseobacterium polytrichastri]SHK16587.1 ketopantoate hydroxymethyltransferase [Chryseobacterium polytrichastri]
MSTYTENLKKVTTRSLFKLKQQGEKISVLTAYDYTMAKIIDEAGIDAIIVDDSASNTMIGNATTLSITLDQMINYATSVVNGAKRALIIVDMPFGTCSGNPLKSLENAIRMMRETGADAIKVEGGEEIKDDIKKIIDAGIPVMVHLGLMPQSINKYGSYTVRGKNEEEAQKLISDCLLMEELGAFGLLLEKIPARLATEIAQKVKIPVIGIGAGAGVDGQVLVIQDVMGMNKEFSPKFLRRYADLHTIMTDATKNFISDIKEGDFPNENEWY